MKTVTICRVSVGGERFGDTRIGGKVRFTSLSQEECVRHAQGIYREEGQQPDIFIVDATPTDHTTPEKQAEKREREVALMRRESAKQDARQRQVAKNIEAVAAKL